MSNLPANIADLVGNLEKAQAAAPEEAGDFLYMKMTKGGNWVFGAGDTEFSNDSVFVIDPASYAQGFVAWCDGELLGERMALAGQDPILLSSMPALPVSVDSDGDPVDWRAQKAFAMKGIEGAEEGLQFLYKVSSRGGKAAIAELLAEIIKRGKAGESALCPVVLLDTDSYKHKNKKFGTIYTPILTIDDWMYVGAASEPEPAKVAKTEPEPEPEPEPKAKRARKSRARKAS